VLEGPDSGAEESEAGSSATSISYAAVVMQSLGPICQLNNLS
jgi:hypothetical protein